MTEQESCLLAQFAVFDFSNFAADFYTKHPATWQRSKQYWYGNLKTRTKLKGLGVVTRLTTAPHHSTCWGGWLVWQFKPTGDDKPHRSFLVYLLLLPLNTLEEKGCRRMCLIGMCIKNAGSVMADLGGVEAESRAAWQVLICSSS